MSIETRTLATLEDIEQAVRVQLETWGEAQLVPREILLALQQSGNFLEGAYRNGRLVGFALAFLGRDDEGVHLHSHLLAVSPGERGSGVGFALKMAQRAWAMERNITRIQWTFDPMLSRNAYLNLSKLGAVADRFERNFYGEMEDILNAGDRSDRLFVRWDLNVVRVAPSAEGAVVTLERSPEDRPSVGEAPRPGSRSLVRIPPDYQSLRERDPELAHEWRDVVAAAIESCFSAGQTAVGFLPDSSYVFA